jgi:hypothetical protein
MAIRATPELVRRRRNTLSGRQSFLNAVTGLIGRDDLDMAAQAIQQGRGEPSLPSRLPHSASLVLPVGRTTPFSERALTNSKNAWIWAGGETRGANLVDNEHRRLQIVAQARSPQVELRSRAQAVASCARVVQTTACPASNPRAAWALARWAVPTPGGPRKTCVDDMDETLKVYFLSGAPWPFARVCARKKIGTAAAGMSAAVHSGLPELGSR